MSKEQMLEQIRSLAQTFQGSGNQEELMTPAILFTLCGFIQAGDLPVFYQPVIELAQQHRTKLMRDIVAATN